MGKTSCEAWCAPSTYAPLRKCSKHANLRLLKVRGRMRWLCPWHHSMVIAGRKLAAEGRP